MNKRLFIALNLPADIRRIIHSHCAGRTDANSFRWEAEEKLHLTLKFLGDTPEDMIDSIIQQLKPLKDTPIFPAVLTNFGMFERKKIPTIIWLGMAVTDELKLLNQFIENAMITLGFAKDEKPFHPHITLLRVKPYYDRRVLSEFLEQSFTEMRFMADQVTMYESILMKSGSRYRPLYVVKLKEN